MEPGNSAFTELPGSIDLLYGIYGKDFDHHPVITFHRVRTSLHEGQRKLVVHREGR